MNIVNLNAKYANASNTTLALDVTYTENNGNGGQKFISISVPVSTTVEPWASVVAQVLSGTYGPINPYVPPVPGQVSMRQFRLALFLNGKLTAFEAAINGLTHPQLDLTLIDWEYSNNVGRNASWVITAATTAGMSSTDLDNLFKQAATL